jgi:pimeloyl-ACP methyl ester carboxylesterase
MKLFYREFGSGKPLVILHGFLGFSDNWVTLGKKWAEQYRVIIADARNHGNSPHDQTFSYESMVEDLRYLINELVLDNFVLMGHSMGGKTAMKYAVSFPEKVEKLIVADMGVKYYPVTHDGLLKSLLDLPITSFNSRKEVEAELSKDIADFGVRQFLLKNLDRDTDGKFKWKANLKVLYREIDHLGEALQVSEHSNVTTLFLAGSKSDYILAEDVDEIKSHFPNSRLETINNAGHWLHAEQPQSFYAAVNHFLQET